MQVRPWNDYKDEREHVVTYSVRWMGAYKLTAYRSYKAAGEHEWRASVAGLADVPAVGLEDAKLKAERIVAEELLAIISVMEDEWVPGVNDGI